MAAAVKGYRCIFVMADKQSEEKRALLRAYGAEVVVCPTDVTPDDERSYYRVSDRLAREIPRLEAGPVLEPGQPRGHYRTTGPEIWDATEGRITRFVVALGTGGTVSGAGRYLKEQPGGAIIGADPEGSVYSDSPRPYLTEGIGEDFWPRTYNPASATSSCGSPTGTRCSPPVASAREGILMGQSCGTALWAALQVARDLDRPDAMLVVLLPDSGATTSRSSTRTSGCGSSACWGPVSASRTTTGEDTRPAVVLRDEEIPQPD